MKTASKFLLLGLVVAGTLFVATPRQAEARRWVYYPAVVPAPVVVASPIVAPPVVVASPVIAAPVVAAPVYPYYPAVPRRVYRSYYSPRYIVPAYPGPYMYGY